MTGARRATTSRVLAFVFLLALAATACGSRLSTEQRTQAIGALTGAGGAAAGSEQELLGKGEVPGATGAGGTVAGGAAGAGAAGAAAGGAAAGGAGQAPAGGNGGATDVGVTGNQITVATVSDVSGVQPGLFKSTHQAVEAWAAYQNSQGGLFGRLIKPLLIDDQTNTGGNRSATLDACKKAFALVGSMSAFDDGGADVVDGCGIPDLTAITTNPPRSFNKNTYPIYPNRPDYYIIGQGNYIKEKHPDVIKHGGILWLDAGVTRVNAEQRQKALQKIGFEFPFRQPVQVVESNYTPYVIQMRQQGIQYVTMVSDYQSIVRLVKAMRQQNWYPTVMDWDSVVYSPKFLQQAEGAAENSLFFMNTAMFEEAASNQEIQLYISWLRRVAPGAQPDYFGLYAWSAGRLFSKVAESVGPKLTRKAFIAELQKVHAWGGNGLHAEHDVGGKKASQCIMYGQVKGNKFVRLEPSGTGWFCNRGELMRNPL